MRTLRVLLPASSIGAPRAAWVVVDERGRVIDRGSGPAAEWPAAERREAVVAATSLRVLALALPPLPPDRVEQAVHFALEERLATPLDASIAITGPQMADGRVVTLVASRALARTIAAHEPRFDRVLAEPQLAAPPPAQSWRWCASPEHGFVVTDRGEAFGVGVARAGEVPQELKAALEQAARSGDAPLRVIASVPDAESSRDDWTRLSGVPFEPAAPWSWFAGDGLQGRDLAEAFARDAAPATTARGRAPSLAIALVLFVTALAFHVAATVGSWGWRKIELAGMQRAIVDVARKAGIADASPEDAARRLARQHGAALHAAGRSAFDDAWPRLARAAPALSALPPGTLRSARYAGGAWTVELGALDDAALAAFDARLRGAGLSGIAARTPSGIRVRIEGAA